MYQLVRVRIVWYAFIYFWLDDFVRKCSEEKCFSNVFVKEITPLQFVVCKPGSAAAPQENDPVERRTATLQAPRRKKYIVSVRCVAALWRAGEPVIESKARRERT